MRADKGGLLGTAAWSSYNEGMSGFSIAPLFQKLGLKPGMKVCFEMPPDDYDRTLGPLPATIVLDNELPDGDFDLIQSFMTTREELDGHLPELAAAINKDGMIWVSWPKQTSVLAGDLTENLIREEALKLGLVDVKVCAVDEDWSGLKLVWRRERR